MAGSPPTPVKLLAFDTSTEHLSVAVQAADGSLRVHEGPGGAQASATLVPACLDLLAQAGLALGALDAIVFGRGPGSFTGLRTACAVAQGLAWGAGRPVLGVDTLLAVAEEAHARGAVAQVLALLDARMDQVYAQAWERTAAGWRSDGAARLLAPEDVQPAPGWTLAGNAFDAYGSRLPQGAPRIAALPTAAALLRLAPALLAAGQGGDAASAQPLYIRDKVAQTTEERAAARAASA